MGLSGPRLDADRNRVCGRSPVDGDGVALLADVLRPILPKDADAIASRLIAAFGSVGGVMRAPEVLVSRISADPRVHTYLDVVRGLNVQSLREEVTCTPLLSDSRLVSDYLRLSMAGSQVERLHVLHLDARHLLITEDVHAAGYASAIQIAPRTVFRTAIAVGASGLVLAHNHPSGNPMPSEDDIASTRRLAEIGAVIGIPILDHLIVTSNQTVSMARLGLVGSAR
jgi:DNA repair protein RadC